MKKLETNSGGRACWCLGVLVLAWVFIGAQTARAELSLSLARGMTNSLTLSWNDQGADFSYRVESRSDLANGVWTPCAPTNQWPIRDTRWQDTVAAPAGPRFYRVVALETPASWRGQIISASALGVISRTEIVQALALASAPITPQTGVRVYKIVYRTVDAAGNLTQASGALVVPDVITNALPLLSYQHGTITVKSEAPSSMTGEIIVGVAFGSSGYAAVLPDYLGLGDSPGLHPYHHAQTEASAVIDMLRAAKTFCATNATPLNGQLFLCGYSQGGHATMAAHRELELNFTNELPLTAVAPMAGAYDMSGTTLNDFLSDRVMPNPYYCAYLVMAYRDTYQWTNSLADILLPKYATNLLSLFDGKHDGGQINALLSSQPKTMFQPAFLDSLWNDPTNVFRMALRANDVYPWTPKAPTKLLHCHADQDVLYANSLVAYDYFQSHLATQVVLFDPKPDADHGAGAIPCMLTAKNWFDGMRK